MDTFVSDWVPLQSALHFERLYQNLREARVIASKLESAPRQSLKAFIKLLPNALRRITSNEDIVWQAAFNHVIFEVMYELVELTVVMLAKQLEYSKPLDIPSLHNLLEALSIVFDSSTYYYNLRGKNNRREITVFSWRLDTVLHVPGFLVKVFAAANGEIHSYCAKNGVKQVGQDCECCRPSLEADAVLVNLTRLLVCSGGFDHIMKMLNKARIYSLPITDFFLRPLVHLLEYNVGSKSWRNLIQVTEVGFNKRMKVEFKNMSIYVCSELCCYLGEVVHGKEFISCSNSDIDHAHQLTLSNLLRHVHSMTCWGVTYYGGSVEFERVRGTVGKLQERMWERLLDANCYSMVCSSIGASLEASLVCSPWSPTLFMDWLKEKNAVFKLLTGRYEMKNVSKVIYFVTTLATKGFVAVEQDFIELLKNAGTRSNNPNLTISHTDPDNLIVAAMMQSLDLTAYTSEFFDFALNWLDDCKVDSAIGGRRVFQVLSKLFVCDKAKKWEKRFLKLLWKHSSTIPQNELVDCFTTIVDHYTSDSALKKTFPTTEEQSKLLQECNNADMLPCIPADYSGALNHTELYGQIAQSWEEKEADLHMLTSSKLANILAIGVPCARRDIASECIDRLLLAQKLTCTISADGINSLASNMTSALLPEYQMLQALKEESVPYSKVFEKVQKLSEKHVGEYRSIRQEQYERLVMFFQACCKEKEDIIWEALYLKAKLMATAKKAKIGTGVKQSDTDIHTRMLQKADGAFKKIAMEQRESLERLPNPECALCAMDFSLKRKRACLDPCGHTSACIDCATQAWKRSQTCSLCKTKIQKPIAVPHKLFF